MKRSVNFILTCFDKEAYLPYALEVINSYKDIEPSICVVYNGTDPDFDCDVRLEKNSGLQFGDFEMTKKGFEFFQEKNDSTLFVKLSIDSWLMNEKVLIDIFHYCKTYRVPYAGNYWNTNAQLSTDIFFADIAYGNVFEELKPDGPVFENCMFNAVARLGGRFYILHPREPVHPDNRNECKALNWVMYHELEKNVEIWNDYKENKPMEKITKNYELVCQRASDINQLLPTLNKYAQQCDHITEMGVRTVVSTWAFLAAKPKTFRCYDVNSHPNVQVVSEIAKEAGIDFEFYCQSVIEDGLEIEETDFLFIDTLHQYEQLKKELAMHGNKARKFIGFHDTVTFGHVDENTGQGLGLVPAIDEFLQENPHWARIEVLEFNNGLTILKRK